MNDTRIAELARMAVEVDELEREAMIALEADRLRLDEVHAERRSRAEAVGLTAGNGRRRWVLAGWTAAGLAAAACLGVTMTVGLLAIMPERSPAGTGVAVVPDVTQRTIEQAMQKTREQLASNQPGESVPAQPLPATFTPHADDLVNVAHMNNAEQCCVVIALVRDLGGVLRCVQWRQHEWDVRSVSGMDAQDLKSAVPATCDAGPRQVVLVAVTGPTHSLPRTDESAAELATCILGSPRGCDTDAMCFNGAAARCLPNDVSVKVETVALNR